MQDSCEAIQGNLFIAEGKGQDLGDGSSSVDCWLAPVKRVQ